MRYLASPAGRRLREEVRMDSIARTLRGAAAYPDQPAEARRRAKVVIEAPLIEDQARPEIPGLRVA